jgi:hypothetical protein
MEPSEDMGWEYRIPPYTDIECAITRFFKTMRLVAVGGVDCHSVAAVLQGQRNINDETFRTANA